MGRFYKTGKGDYIDFIYKQPRNLLLQAVKTAEGQIDEQAKLNADLYGQLHSEALEQDVKKRNQILADYKSQINTTAQGIMDNPLAYRGSSQKIRKLSDDISENLQRGELAAFESNVALRKDYKEKLDAQVKAKEITRAESIWNLNKYDTDFKGTKYQSPTSYEQYKGDYFAPKINIFDKIDKRGQGWKANAEERGGWNFKYDQNNDRYIVTSKVSGETVSEKELLESFQDYVLKDNEIVDYYKTRVAPGYFTQEQMLNELSSAITYGVKKYGYTKSSQVYSYKGDPLAAGKASRRAANMQPAVTYDIGTNATQTSAIGNNEQVVAANEDINLQEKNILELGIESIERDLINKKGIKGAKRAGANAEGAYVDEDGDLIFEADGKYFTSAELKTVEKQFNDLRNAVKDGNTTGNYDGLLDVVKGMNDNVKNSVNNLSKTNNSYVAQLRTNTNIVRKSVVNKLMADPSFHAQSYDKQQEQIKALTKKASTVKSNIEVTSYIPDTGTDNVTAGQIMTMGEELVEKKQLFNRNGRVIPMKLNSETGAVELTGQDSNGNNTKAGEYAASITSLLASGALKSQDLISREIQSVTEPGIVLNKLTGKYEQGPVTTVKAVPIEITPGKIVYVSVIKEPLLNTTDALPGMPGEEAKFLHRFVINDVDPAEAKEGQKTPPIEVYIAQSSNDFEFGVSGDKAFVNKLLNSGIDNQIKRITKKISAGVQVAGNYETEGLTTSSSDQPGIVFDNYTMYDDGVTKVTFNNTGPGTTYHIDGKVMQIPAGITQENIKNVITEKVLAKLNNSGIK